MAHDYIEILFFVFREDGSMRLRTILLSAGVLGVSAVAYNIGRIIGRMEQYAEEKQYPSQEFVEALNAEVVYVSSMTETMYPQIFEDGMQPAGSPTEYAESAVVQWLIEDGNVVPYVERDMNDSESLYKATGTVTITDTEDEDEMFVSKLESDGVELEAYGSVENYSPQVQCVVSNHGFHTIEDATCVFNLLNEDEDAHFMCIVA